jgi:hypothetical protein
MLHWALFLGQNSKDVRSCTSIFVFNAFFARKSSSSGGRVCSSRKIFNELHWNYMLKVNSKHVEGIYFSVNHLLQAYFVWRSKELNQIFVFWDVTPMFQTKQQLPLLGQNYSAEWENKYIPNVGTNIPTRKSSFYKTAPVTVTAMRTTDLTKLVNVLPHKHTYQH